MPALWSTITKSKPPMATGMATDMATGMAMATGTAMAMATGMATATATGMATAITKTKVPASKRPGGSGYCLNETKPGRRFKSTKNI